MLILGITGQARCSLLQKGFSHPIPASMGQAHGISRAEGLGGWSNSCEEYNQLLYVFTSLSLPHSDIIVRMKYMK